ncbi:MULTISPECIES: VOC family protein [Burkholderia cepacia complex]|uniref:VOC family protein n=2 Tax=Burkholderia cepacia complex TaxID=87882 RepID=A0A3R9DE39_9BURK|nr:MULTISPECIES: VOC family protein [Burkholderia cepacia complex]MBJ9728618.1 VOC family protein [Burkholderia cenocepacia]MBR8399548.1 VOC family protein [Burkholderia cenocepacia]MDN7526887.1 VOC family protein [Burkholderia orbicola]RSC14785.1 VOC family protein [Burkholderia cenocepacia]
MQVQPYLTFYGRADEALQFYEKALGAKTMFKMHFKDAPPNPDYPMSPEVSDKVMHASFTIGDSMIMCSDGDCSQPAGAAHAGYSLSLNPATVEEGQKLFDALADGGEVTMPFGKTFWALGFGMAKDRFGVHWMVNVEDLSQREELAKRAQG